MVLYNTEFIVKYASIEKELLEKNKLMVHSNEFTENEDYNYTEEDVLDICDKLYRDELLSVFNIDEIDDNFINNILFDLLTTLKQDSLFQQFLNTALQDYIDKFPTIERDNMSTLLNHNSPQLKTEFELLFFINLFCKQLFYLTHTIIISILKHTLIDDTIFKSLQTESINLFVMRI